MDGSVILGALAVFIVLVYIFLVMGLLVLISVLADVLTGYISDFSEFVAEIIDNWGRGGRRT